jgi:hypothetical protein
LEGRRAQFLVAQQIEDNLEFQNGYEHWILNSPYWQLLTNYAPVTFLWQIRIDELASGSLHDAVPIKALTPRPDFRMYEQARISFEEVRFGCPGAHGGVRPKEVASQAELADVAL